MINLDTNIKSHHVLTKKDYEKSRRIFVYEGCTSVGISSLTSGAFLAGFANFLGASDYINGIIFALPSFVGVVQIFSSLVFEKLEKRKPLITLLSFIYRLLISSIFLIPFFVSNSNVRIWLLAIFYSIACALNSFISPSACNLLVNLTPANIRGKYFSTRDSINIAVATIFTLSMGKVLDHFRNAYAQEKGFLIIAILSIFLTLLNLLCWKNIKEPINVTTDSSIKIRDIFTKPLQDKRFRLIIIFFIIWNISVQVGVPYCSIFMVTRLKLSYTYIMIMGLINSIAKMISAPFWGKLANKHSFGKCCSLSILILGITMFLWTFTNSYNSIIFVPLLNILSGISWSGINLSMFTIPFEFSPEEGRTMYLSLNSTLSGLLGFISTLICSLLLKYTEGTNFHLFNFDFINIQLLFLLSSLLMFITMIFSSKFIERGSLKNNKVESL